MTRKELERVVHLEPFRPYRLVLISGEQIVVRKPRKSSVSGDQVALVGECREDGTGKASERFRIVRVEKIAVAEHLPIGSKLGTA